MSGPWINGTGVGDEQAHENQFGAPDRSDAMAAAFSRTLSRFRRARRALVCVWRTDPETGRLACSWTQPTDGDQGLARDLGEPPPAFLIAA